MTPDQFATLSADAILAWVRARKIEPPDVYYSARPGEYRAAAFSIAGIASADQLQSVLDSLSKAIGEGQTFRTWKRSIREAGDAPDVLALGRARLDNIFRTNLQGSYMRGLYERQAQTVASRPFLMYDAINDDRVRPSHLALDNYIAPADSSFWRTHRPPLGYRCFLPGQTVRGDFRVGLKSAYLGPAVEVVTAGGNRLSATANHPVLTPRGWVRAAELREGDDVIADPVYFERRRVPGVVHNDDAPSRVEDVFDSLATQALGFVPVAAFDFHDDASLRKGNVYVAGADGELMHGYQAAPPQRREEGRFVGARDCRSPAGALLSNRAPNSCSVVPNPGFAEDSVDIGRRASDLAGERALADRDVPVSEEDGALDLVIGRSGLLPRGAQLFLDSSRSALDPFPLEPLRLARGSRSPVPGEPSGERGATDAQRLGQREDAFSGVESRENRRRVFGLPLAWVDRVVSVRAFHYEGSVFDFETKTGVMLAGGIVAHNCRCTLISLTEAQARARGWAGQSPPAAGTPDEGWDYDKADGIKPGVARAMKRAAAAAAPPIAAKLAKIENTPPPPQTLDDFLALGKEALVRIEKSIPASRRDADGVPLADAFAEALRAEIRAVHGAPAKLKIANSPDAKVVARMNDASAVYPAEWIEAANRMGKLRVRGDMWGGRGFHYTVGPLMNGTSFRLSQFGRVSGVTGEGYIFLSRVAGMSGSVSTAIHEIAHRIQSTFPRLDDLFQTLHARKTVGDPLVALSKIHPGHGYRWDEVTKPDHLPNACFGKLYKHESGADPDGAAKEMITMSFEALLHGHQAFTQKALLTGPSRDLAELAVAVLLHWKP